MKITYNWLGEYIELPWTWQELVDRLTMSGLEIESATDLSAGFDGIVVGKVQAVEKHPNADRLRVCTVDVGTSVETIVCGAPNVAGGQSVAVCLPGQRLPDGTPIDRAKIRGVESAGMICSEVELGIGEDASGILVLTSKVEAGRPFAEQTGRDDIQLDFEVTPNRPDCLSILGIAREVRALTGAELRYPASSLKEAGQAASESVTIEVQDADLCPRYCGRVIRNLHVGPSPDWLVRRLGAVGLRPINNVVDITNYVLMELGHPLHAFDLHKLENHQVVVRRARAGESVETLDGVSRSLNSEILVIADGGKPIAVAGIMGGRNTEVGADTVDVLLESAYFHAGTVRRGKATLGMQSEAAMRFERGADFHAAPVALDRAAGLITEICGGEVAPGMIDVVAADWSSPEIRARLSRIRKLLNVDFDDSRIVEILELLGCQVEQNGDDLAVVAPSFRPDLEREVDIVEEVGRIYGYDSIAGSTVVSSPVGSRFDSRIDVQREIRNRLSGLGLDEVITNSIVDGTGMNHFADDAHAFLRLTNPPTEDQHLLRPTLVGSLLEVARRNFNQRASTVAVFELGACYQMGDASDAVSERVRLAGLWAGSASASPWRDEHRDVDFLDLKGIVETLLAALAPEFHPAEVPWLRPGCAASIAVGGEQLGFLGQAQPQLSSAFDLERRIFIFEVDFDRLAASWSCPKAAYDPLPKFPPIERDLAVVVPTHVGNGEVESHILGSSPELIEAVELFDVYQGEQIPSDRKSLAYAIRMRSRAKTLEDSEADEIVEAALRRLGERVGAELR
jgi:phenylalanyl-tRNA synthetase beta chain